MTQPYSVNLDRLDVTIICDKSGSMGETDTPTGQSRWAYAEEFIKSFVEELGAHDDNGIDIVFFAAAFQAAEGVKPESFRQVWNGQRTGGSTALAGPLTWAIEKAKKNWSDKPQLIVLLTDGQPTDENQIAPIIIGATKAMDKDEQLAILILQVGKDSHATRFLQQLDDDLESKGAKFDVVDVAPIEDVANKSVQDVVNKAFND